MKHGARRCGKCRIDWEPHHEECPACGGYVYFLAMADSVSDLDGITEVRERGLNHYLDQESPAERAMREQRSRDQERAQVEADEEFERIIAANFG